MLASQVPSKIPVPFAELSTLVTDIPLTPTGAGRASWQQGFTQVNMTLIAAGGIPPFGFDMNGVLQAVSAWGWWQAAGGPVMYDAGFSSENGGYPFGAFLQSANGLGWWFSTVDDNTSDPDTGGGNWTFVPLEQCYAGNPNTHAAGQAATGSSPPSWLWDSTNLTFWICKTSGNAASAVWSPLSILISVNPSVTGTSYPYTIADSGQLRVRKNSGAAMSDSLPSIGAFANGFWFVVMNGDGVAGLTITAPGSQQLNGVAGGSILVPPGKVTWIDADASGNFWIIVPPLPSSFAPQEVYLGSAPGGPLSPGAYVVDTSAGAFTVTLEASPVLGDNYKFRDMLGTFGGNPLTINPNGKTILGASASLIDDVPWSVTYIAYKSGDWEQV